ncbi:MAG: PcfJ domain-containing protein [Gammaproteobacteria bacterium]
MNEELTLPAQFFIEGFVGSRLLNAAARREIQSRKALAKTRRETSRSGPSKERSRDTVALGVAALSRHCRELLQTNPIEITADGWPASPARIRICGALEYVVDPLKKRIFAQSVDSGLHLFSHSAESIRLHNASLGFEGVDVLNPLCTPFWLQFIAYLPGGICGRSTLADMYQELLWKDSPNAVQVLDVICTRAYRILRTDQNFQLLKARLSYWLIMYIGPDLMEIALRARTAPRQHGLLARDINRVWRHWQAFLRMDRENPRLLPVLSAWLDATDLPSSLQLEDAVPAMRQDMLNHNLPPRAWRHLVKHGHRSLMWYSDEKLQWRSILGGLHLFNHARWPDIPPRSVLRLLNDAGGAPESYEEGGIGVPGWFWNWTCNAARQCRHDPAAFRNLQDDIVRWAQLIHEYQPRPDSNQQRRRLHWLKGWAALQETTKIASRADTWGLWLRKQPWEHISRLHVVPLLSPHAVLEEGLAMHNCADRFVDDCAQGYAILLSLRDHATGKRVALMALRRKRKIGEWELHQLAGPCNRKAPDWVRPIARQVEALVRQGDPETIQDRVTQLLNSLEATNRG